MREELENGAIFESSAKDAVNEKNMMKGLQNDKDKI